MKKKLFIVAGILLASSKLIAAPAVMTYEGQFEDSAGLAITQPISLEFSFWDSPTTGNQISTFSDLDQNITPLQGGYVTTSIGDDPGNPVPQFIFEEDAVYLNIKVNGEDLSPRKKMTSTGFAMQAVDAVGSDAITATFEVGDGESIQKGDFVTLASLNGLIYKGSCPEVRNTTDIPIELLSNQTYYTFTNFGSDKIIVHNTKEASVGQLNGDQFVWTPPALFSVIEGFTNFDFLTLSDTRFLIRYFDPFDNTIVLKAANLQGNQLQFDNNNLYLNAPYDSDIEQVSDSEFILISQDAVTNITSYKIVTYSATGFVESSPVVVAQNAMGPRIEKISDNRFVYFISYDNGDPRGSMRAGIIDLINPVPMNTFIYDYVTPGDKPNLQYYVNRAGENVIGFSRTTSGQFSGIFTPNENYSSLFVIDDNNALTQIPSNSFSLYSYYIGNNISIDLNVSIRKLSLNPTTFSITQEVLATPINCSTPIIAIGDDIIMKSDNKTFILDQQLETPTYLNNLGIALTDGEAGDKVKVVLHGLVDGYTDLIPSTYYQHDGRGGIVQNYGGNIFAISPTTIFLER